MGRPPPTSFEWIEAVAMREPDRIAVVQDRQAWTYASLLRGIDGLGRCLQALGVQRGQRVALSQPGFYLQLLGLLACENIGAVSALFSARDDADAPALFGLVDWVLSEAPQQVPVAARFQLADTAFIEQALAAPTAIAMQAARAVLEPHEPQRLIRTSGSSGLSKFMQVSRQAMEHWIDSGAENSGYGRDTRLMLAGPLVINTAFSHSCACLRRGGTLLAVSGSALPALDPSHIWALPLHLERLLAQLPPQFQARRKVFVGTVGGFVSPQLRERALQVFGGPLISRYGANETGGICYDLDAQGRGVLSAGVDVRIVDEAGAQLPAGQTGRIVLRTPAMADGYVGAATQGDTALRDGWFHSGDWGALVGPRLLQLAGRHDDLVNLGGIKLPAVRLEEQIRGLLALRDCAVLAVRLDGGAVTVGIALAQEPGTEQAPQLRLLEQSLQLGTGARVLFVDALPQLASGKVDRLALLRLFATS
ncbi:class I adenylate-forming enzyme family protein [uncultured Ramlibacter sp.]|uniref:class I adenylate-forming enzyme family protein n=1 Tax=uncultured Ramlibacter sp. TaxID=260755 RepID=UPI00261A51A7|nr:class I adenylate-forming enzyme family protein [uncultured Ramlibacter sp.]